jgi:hypothetical protein
MQNIAKTLMSGLKTLIDNKIRKSVADWNQNDTEAVNYVKNRTHWEEEKITDTDIISEMTVNIPEDNDYVILSEKCPILVVGNTYTVILNGIEYHCVARAVDDYVVLGNETVWGGINEGNGEPFAIDSYTHGEICLNVSIAGEYTIRIFHREQQFITHKLDKKYLKTQNNGTLIATKLGTIML